MTVPHPFHHAGSEAPIRRFVVYPGRPMHPRSHPMLHQHAQDCLRAFCLWVLSPALYTLRMFSCHSTNLRAASIEAVDTSASPLQDDWMSAMRSSNLGDASALLNPALPLLHPLKAPVGYTAGRWFQQVFANVHRHEVQRRGEG